MAFAQPCIPTMLRKQRYRVCNSWHRVAALLNAPKQVRWGTRVTSARVLQHEHAIFMSDLQWVATKAH